ncbi:hypothetical protein K3U93_13075 [Mycobacterium malmoense]|uniref:hypothetical protein n=1 Tax=Mycobacterium malmoense TaxID=1780 RepID=UPI00111C0A73|nr:hypothetical protein [Mycobacterium malmoense]QZA15714.1 hypothetical protein K3U93_13075 [Mycobacterium malmoense]UNB92527.1 hypothetical protein H5T25_13065 [Mycobacterium malmoense]
MGGSSENVVPAGPLGGGAAVIAGNRARSGHDSRGGMVTHGGVRGCADRGNDAGQEQRGGGAYDPGFSVIAC